jgi:hypothetical protein
MHSIILRLKYVRNAVDSALLIHFSCHTYPLLIIYMRYTIKVYESTKQTCQLVLIVARADP